MFFSNTYTIGCAQFMNLKIVEDTHILEDVLENGARTGLLLNKLDE